MSDSSEAWALGTFQKMGEDCKQPMAATLAVEFEVQEAHWLATFRRLRYELQGARDQLKPVERYSDQWRRKYERVVPKFHAAVMEAETLRTVRGLMSEKILEQHRAVVIERDALAGLLDRAKHVIRIHVPAFDSLLGEIDAAMLEYESR